MADFTDEFKVSLIADARDVDAKIKASKAKLQAFQRTQGQQASVKIRVNIAELERKLDKARADLRKFKKEGDKLGELKARLNIKGLQEQKTAANKALRDIQKQADKTKKSFFSLNGIVRDAIKAFAGFFLIRKAGQALRFAFNAALDFESAFAGVRKTVEATEKEFAVLSDGLRALAKEIPVAVEELARIGELGGQLGVAQENILEFTETIAKIAVTTNLTEEQAATSFARIANIMQTPIENTENLASAVVDLGNSFATTEAEIVEFATRIAPAGKALGLTGEDLLGISAAFTSVGIKAEAGGTAVQKVLFKINAAVLGGGKELQGFADVAGLSAEQFAESFRDKPVEALDKFIQGLGKAGPEGQALLAELTGGSERVTTAFLAAAGAGDLFTKAVEQSNKASKENTALQEEADKRFETRASRLKLVGARWKDLAITIGGALLVIIPVLEFLTEGFELFIKTLGDMASDIVAIFSTIGTFVSTLGTLAGAVFGLGGGLRSLSDEMNELVFSASKAVEATRNLVDVNTNAAKVLKGNDKDVAEFRAELSKKQLEIDKAAHKIQLALLADKTDAEIEAAETELDLAIKNKDEFLALNSEKIKELKAGNHDILLDNRQISDAIVKLGEDEVRNRLDLATEFADGNIDLQEAILNATGIASRKELEIMVKKWNSAGSLAEQFQTELAKLMDEPIFQIIGLILPDGEELIAKKAAADFKKNFFKNLEIDFDAGDFNIPSVTDDDGKGGGGGSQAEKDAKEAEKAVKDFEKSLDNAKKAAKELRDDIKDFYQDIQDSIDGAKEKQKELNKEFADFKSEETAGFVEEAAERDVDLSEDAADIEKEIADLKAEEGDNQDKINEKEQELNDILAERAEIAAFLKGEFTGIDFGLDDEGIAKTAQDVFDDIVELKKLSEFEQSKVALDAGIERKNAEIQIEIEKQQGIIDVQEKFLALQKRNDEEAQKIKKGLIDLATADEILTADERSAKLAELGFEDLTKEQEKELLKQFTTAKALDDELVLVESQQQAILDTKEEFLALAEKAFGESVDRQVEKQEELNLKIEESIAAMLRLQALGGSIGGGSVGGAEAGGDTQNINITNHNQSNVDADAALNNMLNEIQ